MLATILVLLVALLHVYILVLEMFRWEAPRTRKIFGNDEEFAARTRVMAANQGLYNGFLAAGLFWGLLQGDAGQSVILFFLLCVLVAGIYGAMTAMRRILYIQAVPAAVTILAVLLT